MAGPTTSADSRNMAVNTATPYGGCLPGAETLPEAVEQGDTEEQSDGVEQGVAEYPGEEGCAGEDADVVHDVRDEAQ